MGVPDKFFKLGDVFPELVQQTSRYPPKLDRRSEKKLAAMLRSLLDANAREVDAYKRKVEDQSKGEQLDLFRTSIDAKNRTAHLRWFQEWTSELQRAAFGELNQQRANAFLSLELEAGHLSVYCRDPSSDKLVPLHPSNWRRFMKPEPLAWAPNDDFLPSTDYGVIGSDGTRFYGQLSNAYVSCSDFKKWIHERVIIPIDRAHAKTACKSAILGIWQGLPPRNLRAKERDKQIRAWLTANDHEIPATRSLTSSIKRALAELRSELDDPYPALSSVEPQ